MDNARYTSVDLGRLLYRSHLLPRRYQEQFLKDLGGEGSAEELDQLLALAAADKQAVAECARLEAERKNWIDISIIGRVAEMIADIRLKMQAVGLTEHDIADRCDLQPDLVAAYLNGSKEPDVTSFVKLATAVGCVWRLQPSVANSQSNPPA